MTKTAVSKGMSPGIKTTHGKGLRANAPTSPSATTTSTRINPILPNDAAGNLYGATNGEGANGYGSVFKLTPSNGHWKFTDLYDFLDGDDGGDPYGALAVDDQGNIFGTTNIGGSDNQGVVFEITQ